MTTNFDKLEGATPEAGPYIPEGAPATKGEMTVEGTVQARQFESILLDQIYTRKEGHGYLRTAVVCALATVFLPELAIYDLVRYGLFRVGMCNGKSWSLIETASEAARSLAARVTALMQPKVAAPEEANAVIEQAMKTHVEQIVAGYLKEQGGWIGHLFDSSKAIEGEKQIRASQGRLVQVMAQYLQATVKRSEDFELHLNSVKQYIRTLFDQAAEDNIYVENKVERKGPREMLSTVAIREFEAFTEGHLAIATSFLGRVQEDFKSEQSESLAEAPTNLLAHLKLGIEQGLITPTQAKQTVQERSADVYMQAVAVEGAKKAAPSVRKFLEKGIESKLFTAEEAAQIYVKTQPTPQELTEAVVIHVIRYKDQNPGARPAIADQLIANAAHEFKKQGILAPEQEIAFLNDTKDRLSAVETELNEKAEAALRAQKEVEATAQLEAEQEGERVAALQAKQAADELVAAQKTAEEQKIAFERQSLFNTLKNFLNAIAEKQKELLRRYSTYERGASERGELVKEINAVLQAKVKVGKEQKEMTVLQAYEYRSRKIAAINESNRTPDEQLAKISQFDKDFGTDAITVIARLHQLEEQVTLMTKAMSEILKGIDALDLEIGADLATYKKFAKGKKKTLATDQRLEVLQLEKQVFSTQESLNDKYRKVHHLNLFSDLPSEKAEAYELNVDTYQTRPEAEVRPPLMTRLWNGVSAPFAYAAHFVGITA